MTLPPCPYRQDNSSKFPYCSKKKIQLDNIDMRCWQCEEIDYGSEK